MGDPLPYGFQWGSAGYWRERSCGSWAVFPVSLPPLQGPQSRAVYPDQRQLLVLGGLFYMGLPFWVVVNSLSLSPALRDFTIVILA